MITLVMRAQPIHRKVAVWRRMLFGALVSCSVAADPLSVEIGLITMAPADRIPLSSLQPRFTDNGSEGAAQGIRDNNTTGRFTGQDFALNTVHVDNTLTAATAFRDLHARGVRLFLLNLTAPEITVLAAAPEARDSVLFNIGSALDELRVKECRPNLLHTAPSRAMLADALAQYLNWKRWTRWFLVVGKSEQDRAYADALQRAAARFGGKIVKRKAWTFEAGARRTDSGHVREQQAVNAFTQVDDYDILLVADEADVFGEYLNYRTYQPRPVGGTQGLYATAWSGVHEQWGATQFQRRFRKHAGRLMTELDYAAWLAIRTVGEAATRIGSVEAQRLIDFVKSDEFKLAAFKGVPVSYRPWNGQLRQPLLLASPRVVVSVSPQQGFLHQFSELDTLGYDRLEVDCSD